MTIFKKFFFIIFFLLLSINILKAENKVSYIDIDYVLNNTIAGKLLLDTLKREEESKISQYRKNDKDFKNKEKRILAKKNLISKDEISKELKILQVEFQKYTNDKISEIQKLKLKRNKNIINFLDLINPITEKYMADNTISILLDKKNVFMANKNYEITNNLIEQIDNQIKTIEIKK